MKRAVIAAVVLILVAVGAGILLFGLHHASGEMLTLADELTEAVLRGDRAGCLTAFDELEARWYEMEFWVSFATGKKKTEPVGLSLHRLKSLLITFDPDLMILELGQLECLCENLWDDERPSLENML